MQKAKLTKLSEKICDKEIFWCAESVFRECNARKRAGWMAGKQLHTHGTHGESPSVR